MSTDGCCEWREHCDGTDCPAEVTVGAREDSACGQRWRTLVAELRGRPTCSVDRAAEALGIGRSTAYAAVRDGSLPSIRISNRILVPTAKLLALLGVEEAA